MIKKGAGGGLTLTDFLNFQTRRYINVVHEHTLKQDAHWIPKAF